MATPFGHHLLNDVLPDGYKVTGPLTKSQLHEKVVGLAKSDPAKYVDVITRLKRRGDEIATLEGISVGLDDIEPDYAARDAIITPLAHAVANEKDPDKRTKLVVDAQTKLLAQTRTHPGSMTQMALSGARGNIAQLMKIVTTPIAANSEKKGVDPWIIRHSYAEGLTPAEYWVTAPEARANNVATVVSVSQPGELNKLLIANMSQTQVTAVDCGTHNGLPMAPDDPYALDRHLARDESGYPRNAVVDPPMAAALSKRGVATIHVRSPLTCAAGRGVCQMCQGLSEKGHVHPLGTPVGLRAAQALSEPLTQMALSSKHAVLTVKEKSLEPRGFKGVRQLLEVPKNYRHEALLAPRDGRVERVEAAPQGGHFLYFDGEKLYLSPELTPTVKAGDRLEAGDTMSDGSPHPVKVVQLKGLGDGRKYFVDALHKTYARDGVKLDKRHLELLAKAELNHVRLLDADPEHPELLKGDTIDYNRYREAYGKDTTELPTLDAVGRVLGAEVFHHTVGTRITPNLAAELKQQGVKSVTVLKRSPAIEFVMKPIAMNPLLSPDWMGRLGHRFLKDTLLQAAAFGETTDLHGHHPVPAYAFGAEIRRGPGGTY